LVEVFEIGDEVVECQQKGVDAVRREGFHLLGTDCGDPMSSATWNVYFLAFSAA
jgi:hypothetical protein